MRYTKQNSVSPAKASSEATPIRVPRTSPLATGPLITRAVAQVTIGSWIERDHHQRQQAIAQEAVALGMAEQTANDRKAQRALLWAQRERFFRHAPTVPAPTKSRRSASAVCSAAARKYSPFSRINAA